MMPATTCTIGGLMLCAVTIPVHATTVTATNSNDSVPYIYRQRPTGATPMVVDSTVTGDRASGGNVGFGGGGIYNDGSLTIINSTISGNFADSGFPYNLGIAGGIFSQGGTLTITNCTIAGNFADNRG